MNKLLTWLLSVAPARHKIQIRLFQIRYQRAVRVGCTIQSQPALSVQIVNMQNAFLRKLLQDWLRRLCNIINQPVPPTEWIALNHDQVDLFLTAQP